MPSKRKIDTMPTNMQYKYVILSDILKGRYMPASYQRFQEQNKIDDLLKHYEQEPYQINSICLIVCEIVDVPELKGILVVIDGAHRLAALVKKHSSEGTRFNPTIKMELWKNMTEAQAREKFLDHNRHNEQFCLNIDCTWARGVVERLMTEFNTMVLSLGSEHVHKKHRPAIGVNDMLAIASALAPRFRDAKTLYDYLMQCNSRLALLDMESWRDPSFSGRRKDMSLAALQREYEQCRVANFWFGIFGSFKHALAAIHSIVGEVTLPSNTKTALWQRTYGGNPSEQRLCRLCNSNMVNVDSSKVLLYRPEGGYVPANMQLCCGACYENNKGLQIGHTVYSQVSKPCIQSTLRDFFTPATPASKKARSTTPAPIKATAKVTATPCGVPDQVSLQRQRYLQSRMQAECMAVTCKEQGTGLEDMQGWARKTLQTMPGHAMAKVKNRILGHMLDEAAKALGIQVERYSYGRVFTQQGRWAGKKTGCLYYCSIPM